MDVRTMWNHVYLILKNILLHIRTKPYACTYHVESCISNIEEYFITHKDKTLCMYVPCRIMYI